MFSSGRLGLAEQYAASLADDGVVRGLIGPREVPRLWVRHLVNCALLAPLLPQDAEVCDIGSGAGLPGIVLAIARPDLSLTLVEPLLRRTTYLSEITVQLGLDNVEVVRGRAESLHGKRRFDVVTSRAVAPLPRLLEWSMPLVRPEGELIAMKGSQVLQEMEDAEAELRGWGCAPPVVEELVLPTVPGADPAPEEPGQGAASGQTTYGLRVSWADPGSVGSSDAAAGRSGAPGTSGARRQRSAGGRQGRRRPRRAR